MVGQFLTCTTHFYSSMYNDKGKWRKRLKGNCDKKNFVFQEVSSLFQILKGVGGINLCSESVKIYLCDITLHGGWGGDYLRMDVKKCHK